MKSISASIVILAGMTVFAVSGIIGHEDTRILYALVGGCVAIIGLRGWYLSMMRDDNR